MGSSTCVDSVLNSVELLEKIFRMEHDGLKMLKLELKLLRTFLLCVRKFSNYELSDYADDDSKFLTMASSLHSLEYGIYKNEVEFNFLYLRLKDVFRHYDLSNVLSSFREKIISFKQKINELYIILLDCSPSLMRDEFMEFIDSLLENVVDLRSCGKAYYDQAFQEVIEALEEKLTFLKNFLCFAILRGVEWKKLEDLLTHFEIVAVNAAQLSCMCWFDRDDVDMCNEIRLKVSKLVEKIKPVDSQVRQIYIEVLIASNLSGSSHVATVETGKDTLRDFVDSLLGNLWELLVGSTSTVQIFVMDQMQKLYEGLMFLRNTLGKQGEKFDELHEKMKTLIGATIHEAGIIICSLFVHETGEGLAKEIEVALSDSLENIKLIKAVISTFNFPRTNELGFIDFLLGNLKELASCKVDSIAFAKNIIQTVHDDLVFLRSFLMNLVEQHNQPEMLQALWNCTIEAAYKAKCVIYSLVAGDLPDSWPTLSNTIIEEIKLIKIEALEIADKYSLVAKKVFKTRQVPLQGSIPVMNDVVVGFNDEAKTIIDRLTRGSTKLEIVSIVGMPGIGKTTLAKKVFNDPSVRYHFHICAWCSVSPVYHKKDLFLEILFCCVPTLFDQFSEMNEHDLSEKLYRQLKGKRYVVVLDDVWDIEVWNGLEGSFPDDTNGSRILLTSRLNKVALQVKPSGKPHSMSRLTEDESWELLRKKLFLEENYPLALGVTGMQIAKNCNGLPLTIVIIAGILATLEQDGWEEVAERISSNTVCGTERCMDTLELSYRNLPNYLRPCLLYFGAFLEDQEIPIQKLMWLWIAEGFVHKTELKSLEDVAEEYMMDLIGRNLVLVAKQRSTGGVKTCRIHDLLREFCLAKAKEENFLQLLHGCDELYTLNEPRNIRRLCIYCEQENFKKSRLFSPKMGSLLVFGYSDGCPLRWSTIPFVFCIFKFLRVLDLGQVDVGKVFPGEIELLVELRYLAVRGMMNSIPSSIINLSNLAILLVEGYKDVSLPATIWEMKKLRHLHVSGIAIDFSLSEVNLESSSDLANLFTLSTPNFLFGQRMEKILSKFPNIRRLKCNLIESLESKQDGNKIVVMDFMSRLESLNLSVFGIEQYDTEFRFPLNLKKLTLSNFNWSIISTIGKLPNLEVLKLQLSYEGKIWDLKEGEFPKLRILKLKSLGIVKWIDSGNHFPCLQKLLLHRCWRLEEIPSCLGYIPTLETIELCWCPDSLVALVRDIEEQQVTLGNEDMNILIFQE